MEQTLKVTNVLSDPTRYSIYETFLKERKPMTVADIAEIFDIHPNVARLHLTKLSEIDLLIAYYEKSGRGGRPSRVYELSDEVIELTFPHRDYRLLAQMMLETFMGLGKVGKDALFETGKKYGKQIMEQNFHNTADMSATEKIRVLEEKSALLGMYPRFEYNAEKDTIIFTITNCPFKELAKKDTTIVCNMHNHFLKGMLEAVFPNVKLEEKENMFKGCNHCRYVAEIS